jgi:hypothetical protein
MKEQLEQRRKALKAEYESGQKMIAESEASLGNMRTSMLRISGAIQVLEELLAATEEEPKGDGKAKGKQIVKTAAD